VKRLSSHWPGTLPQGHAQSDEGFYLALGEIPVGSEKLILVGRGAESVLLIEFVRFDKNAIPL
jgi:hypothetical protein